MQAISRLLFSLVILAFNTHPGNAQSVSSSVATSSSSSGKVDFVKAKPFDIPIAKTYSDEQANKARLNTLGAQSPPNFVIPGSSAGKSEASATGSALILGLPEKIFNDQAVLYDFGTKNLPFSTARADLDPIQTNTAYPYRAIGKLFFNNGGNTYICSASLVKRGLVLTAAHCVAKFGNNTYYSDWTYVPGYRDGVAPFGAWTTAKAYVLTSYLKGTDPCTVQGVICQNDIAILALNQNKDDTGKLYYPGDATGWLSLAWDRLGFTANNIIQVTQVGYPGCLDYSAFMERNDAQGVIDKDNQSNTIIGSLMCGGSSGGPWIINFGVPPSLTGTTFGGSPGPNQVIGVTSWGSTDNAVKWMGASPFTSSNVPTLINAACAAYADACKQ
jgi:V8-like Glu-specific endopeptidase